MFEYLKGKRVLVTGGAGTVGHELAKQLKLAGVEAHAVFSRNEASQFKLQQIYPHIKCYWGDVRVRREIDKAFIDFQPNVVIHAAAVKVVPIAEREMINTFETNAMGTYNVAMACLEHNVDVACMIGTDKQCAPVNVYGMTKHIGAAIFSDANRLEKTRFVSVRYGNVLCSRSSLGVIIMDQAKQGQDLTVTDPSMTRFFFTIQEGVDLINEAVKAAWITKSAKRWYGETYSTQMCAVELKDLFEVVANKYNVNIKTIGRRPGEKSHESLMAEYELADTIILDRNRNPHYAPQHKLLEYATIPHLKEWKLFQNDDEVVKPTKVFSSDMAPRLTKPEIWNILEYAYENTWKD